MAKIGANGDRAAIKLQKPDGCFVVLTERGRLLEQKTKGGKYSIVDSHWATCTSPTRYQFSMTRYLLDHKYPDAIVIDV